MMNIVIMSKDIKIAFISIVVLRLSQLLIDYNYDRPDEYWQGPEIAHKIAYGYGFQTWQWIMSQPIRSPLYQIYLSLGYKISLALQLSDHLQQISVKFMQILIGCICDWFLIKIANHYFKNLSVFTYLCILTNWYYFSMMNRTYINSVEACLTTTAFYYWICRKQRKWNDLISRLVVCLIFIVRPTSIIVWAIIWPYELITTKESKIRFIFKNIIQMQYFSDYRVIMVLTAVAFNSCWYGKLVWVEFNFFKYNVLMKWSELYGVNPYLYYFYFSLPLIMGAYLIPFAISIVKYLPNLKFWLKRNSLAQLKQQNEDQWKEKQLQMNESNNFWQLFAIILFILLVLSFSTHKQDRFILLILPFLLILAIKGLQSLSSNKLVLMLIIVINISMFLTISVYGKTGGIDILRQLRSEIDSNSQHEDYANMTIMYLCQPHSLPLYSILLRNVTVDIINTSPLRYLKNFNETQKLLNNPRQLYDEMKSTKPDPDFIIVQQKYALQERFFSEKYRFLLEYNYEIIQTYKNINIWEQYFIGYDGLILLKKH